MHQITVLNTFKIIFLQNKFTYVLLNKICWWRLLHNIFISYSCLVQLATDHFPCIELPTYLVCNDVLEMWWKQKYKLHPIFEAYANSLYLIFIVSERNSHITKDDLVFSRHNTPLYQLIFDYNGVLIFK